MKPNSCCLPSAHAAEPQPNPVIVFFYDALVAACLREGCAAEVVHRNGRREAELRVGLTGGRATHSSPYW
jgi:hypothetical protein